MRLLSLALIPAVAAGLQLQPAMLRPQQMSRAAVSPVMGDMDTIIGVGTALIGVGGGIGLIALTENAGKRNDDVINDQPCVVCKTKKVVDCPVCKATGQDQFAQYVAGVQEMTGEAGSSQSVNTVTVDDWDAGSKEVVMFADILEKYPVKATENICQNCDGRGVVVCDNCEGTGLQPRFLERYSPDDFMD